MEITENWIYTYVPLNPDQRATLLCFALPIPMLTSGKVGGRQGERMNKSWKKVHLERVPQIDSRVDRTEVVIEEMKKYFKRKKISHI